MLWSLLKILLFVVLVAALTYGANLLMENGPGLRVAVGDVEFVLGPLQAVIVALLLVAAVWLVLKVAGLLVAVLRFINGDETAISRYFSRSRERRGFQALADGMIALASGEARLAMANATKAERYLRRPELTNILAAQAAEMLGDNKKATETYKKMVTIDQTRFVGVCGLMKQKLAEGDTDTAMKLAEKAFAIKPRHGETQDTLLKLQAQAEDWKGARETLNAKLRHGSLPRDVHKRRDAVLALCEARDCAVDGKMAKSHELALEANRLSPDLVPAAVMAARAYVEQGKPNLASRLIKRAWEAQPHPDLAAAYAEIVPDETPQDRLTRFAELTALRADDRETRMLLAELNIAAEDFVEARKALGDLPETGATVRVLTLMAAIERGQGADDSVVRGYLASALSAPGEPQWICENCGTIHDSWQAVCKNCGAFDSITWKTAPAAPLALPGGSGMLPLLVGGTGAAQNE
ncbi:heme biosynthesis protein HemY [Rhodovulum adriaticum]|uniref:HemY protein n=1 Tax=Rhodovulum adriaticum TaxID=35804 RepID=A0A4R2P134_RHOAD|nr:heme biosynthesis HemY N-terminal domain-containing protein [Rhodovulum adriaticum]MBK1634849.1 heme biosynthesis protein HemY [Rhodovulum adriaticum]TCP27571.1 HemY protein [Rhodovulum adriaticum]